MPAAAPPPGQDFAAQDVAVMKFEDALAELERIVKGMEGGQLRLDDAIAAYERGTTLRRHCEAKLTEAETRVQAIVAGADGSLALRSADQAPQ